MLGNASIHDIFVRKDIKDVSSFSTLLTSKVNCRGITFLLRIVCKLIMFDHEMFSKIVFITFATLNVLIKKTERVKLKS